MGGSRSLFLYFPVPVSSKFSEHFEFRQKLIRRLPVTFDNSQSDEWIEYRKQHHDYKSQVCRREMVLLVFTVAKDRQLDCGRVPAL